MANSDNGKLSIETEEGWVEVGQVMVRMANAITEFGVAMQEAIKPVIEAINNFSIPEKFSHDALLYILVRNFMKKQEKQRRRERYLRRYRNRGLRMRH